MRPTKHLEAKIGQHITETFLLSNLEGKNFEFERNVADFEQRNFYRLVKAAVQFFPEEPLWKEIYVFFRSLRRRKLWTFSRKQQYWQNCIVPVHENNFDVILHKQIVISGVLLRILADNLKHSSKQNCAALLILHYAHWEEQFSIKTFSESLKIYDFPSALDTKVLTGF